MHVSTLSCSARCTFGVCVLQGGSILGTGEMSVPFYVCFHLDGWVFSFESWIESSMHSNVNANVGKTANLKREAETAMIP